MKKLISLLLTISVILTLVGCNTVYEPVPSTEEEARVVMTLTFDGEIYEIKYELYRAFFLTYKSEIDGGDESVWTGESANEYIAKADKLIVSRAAEIFATIHEARKIGFNPYSNIIDNEIHDYVRVSVEGGSFGDTRIEGEGSYEKYLAYLKEMYLNYSVQELLIRYSLATTALEEYYLGDESNILDQSGKFEFDEDDVREYYFGSECASIMQIFLYSHAYDYTRVKEIRDCVALKSNKTAVADYMINFSTASYDEILDGSVVGLYELDREYLADFTDAVFELLVGETSHPIKIGIDDDEGYYIVYRIEPSDDYFTSHYNLIEKSFLLNALRKTVADAETSLSVSAEKCEDYSGIIHSEIRMD